MVTEIGTFARYHNWSVSHPDLTGESSMTDREAARSLQRYGGALARGFAIAELHDYSGPNLARTEHQLNLGKCGFYRSLVDDESS